MHMAPNSLGMLTKELRRTCAPPDTAPEPLPPTCTCGGPLPCVSCETEAEDDAEIALWVATFSNTPKVFEYIGRSGIVDEATEWVLVDSSSVTAVAYDQEGRNCSV